MKVLLTPADMAAARGEPVCGGVLTPAKAAATAAAGDNMLVAPQS